MSVKRIAELSGLSVATVSRVINGADTVKEDTRLKVEAAINQLNINPGSLVRRKKSKQKLIGVMVPDLSNRFFSEVINGIEYEAYSHGISCFICNTDEDDLREINYLRLLKEANVSGIIITPTSDDDDSVNNEYLKLLADMKIPIVLIDRDVKYSDYCGVFIDNVRGAFDATTLLLDQGHIEIAIITGPTSSKPGRERVQGYREAFKAKGRSVDESLIHYADFREESGYKFSKHILSEHKRVTAIFPQNNLMGTGCLQALTERGVRIPQDMSVVCFDDMTYPLKIGMKITSVRRPTREMGRIAVQLLSEQFKGKKFLAARRVNLATELIIRGSEVFPVARE